MLLELTLSVYALSTLTLLFVCPYIFQNWLYQCMLCQHSLCCLCVHISFRTDSVSVCFVNTHSVVCVSIYLSELTLSLYALSTLTLLFVCPYIFQNWLYHCMLCQHSLCCLCVHISFRTDSITVCFVNTHSVVLCVHISFRTDSITVCFVNTHSVVCVSIYLSELTLSLYALSTLTLLFVCPYIFQNWLYHCMLCQHSLCCLCVHISFRTDSITVCFVNTHSVVCVSIYLSELTLSVYALSTLTLLFVCPYISLLGANKWTAKT